MLTLLLTMGCAPMLADPLPFAALEDWHPVTGIEIEGCGGCPVEFRLRPGATVGLRGEHQGVRHAVWLWQFWALEEVSDQEAVLDVWTVQGGEEQTRGTVHADGHGWDVEVGGLSLRVEPVQ